jgi:hypothetical protein
MTKSGVAQKLTFTGISSSGILARRRKVPLISHSDHITDNQENVMRERGGCKKERED